MVLSARDGSCCAGDRVRRMFMRVSGVRSYKSLTLIGVPKFKPRMVGLNKRNIKKSAMTINLFWSRTYDWTGSPGSHVQESLNTFANIIFNFSVRKGFWKFTQLPHHPTVFGTGWCKKEQTQLHDVVGFQGRLVLPYLGLSRKDRPSFRDSGLSR